MFKKMAKPYRTSRIDSATAERAGHAKVGRARVIREHLSSAGIAFLAQMAGKVSLAHTSEEFPHIINKLAPHAYRPPLMIKALDRVLIDDRPERQGFPFETVRELGQLRELYSRYLG